MCHIDFNFVYHVTQWAPSLLLH